jgi:hypothetical protein
LLTELNAITVAVYSTLVSSRTWPRDRPPPLTVRAARYKGPEVREMSFGRNPHVAKAEAAELKATSAKDSTASEHAWREAGRLWERAADRETDPKRRQQYTTNAERARATADDPDVAGKADDSEPEGD